MKIFIKHKLDTYLSTIAECDERRFGSIEEIMYYYYVFYRG